MNRTQTEYSHIPPVKGLHKMIRASGYQPVDCILEYVDNSIDAKAKNIDILLYSGSDDKHLDRLLIVDRNGSGMSAEELLNGLTIAFQRRHRDASEIGHYGFGLKSASLNLGDELVLVSKKASALDFVGARVDFIDQERSNSYAPTQFSTQAQLEMFSHFPTNIKNELKRLVGTDKSITVIQVSKLKVDLASTCCEDFRELLLQRLRLAYSFEILPELIIAVEIHTSDEIDVATVERIDPFYSNNRDALQKDPIVCDLLALVPSRETDGLRIIEKNTIRRAYKRGNKELFTNGTTEAPVCYEICEDNLRVVDNPERALPHGYTEVIPFRMKLVYVKKETYDAEDEELRKKGVWFQRGPRSVAQGLTLGMHGLQAHGHHNQMRACVVFPSELDKYLGTKYNKTIEPKGAIKLAIARIWKDVTARWVKEKEANRRARSILPPSVPPTSTDGGSGSASVAGTDESRGSVAGNDEPVADSELPVEEDIVIPPQFRTILGRVCLHVEGRDIASVDGFGKPTPLLHWLERVFEMKGLDTVKNMMDAMNTHLSA